MNELDAVQTTALQAMLEVEVLPTVPELDLITSDTTKVPLANLSSLGVAFQPLTSAIQALTTGQGGSGIYYVNTKGSKMFSTPEGYIGGLQNATGGVGGGQARLTQLPCDPTMLFMAAALMRIEKKLDTIQETQEEILEFLQEKERSVLQGNLNVLNDVMTNFKFNWNNSTYKTNKHILVQQIKKEAEASIVLYRDQIAKKLKKRSLFHSDLAVNEMLKKIQIQFKDYRMALYLYSYSTFLEVMLLGNFGENYLDSIERRISEYSFQYRSLYTDCYSLMEKYSKSSIESSVLNGLVAASKFAGETIARMPVVSKSQLDESLIEASDKLGLHSEKRVATTLESFIQSSVSVARPFIENIREVNTLCNKSTEYFFDSDNIYVRQLTS